MYIPISLPKLLTDVRQAMESGQLVIGGPSRFPCPAAVETGVPEWLSITREYAQTPSVQVLVDDGWLDVAEDQITDLQALQDADGAAFAVVLQALEAKYLS